jgi:hypothetical protein
VHTEGAQERKTTKTTSLQHLSLSNVSIRLSEASNIELK